MSMLVVGTPEGSRSHPLQQHLGVAFSLAALGLVSRGQVSVLFVLPTLSLLLSKTVEVRGQFTWHLLNNGSGVGVSGRHNVPSPRSDAVLGYDVRRHQLILFGGMPGPVGDTWLYNLSQGAWRHVTTSVHPHARHGAVSGVTGDYFYLATGRGGDGVYYNDMWRFDLRSEQWQALSSQAGQEVTNFTTPGRYTRYTRRKSIPGNNSPPPRFGAAGGIYVTGSRFYVTLGTADMRTDDTYAYDVNTNAWFRESSGCGLYSPWCPHPRYLHSGLVTDKDELLIFSGCLTGGGTAGPCPSHDTWLYNGRTRVWTQLQTCPSPRLYSTLALLPPSDGKRRAVLYGGQSDTEATLTYSLKEDELSVLDLDSGSWTQIRVNGTSAHNSSGELPALRKSAAMATGPEGVFLFGGTDYDGFQTNDLWLLRANASDVERAVSVACSGVTVSHVTIHGILMTAGWGFLLPIGTFVVRLFRGSGRAWFYVHVAVQITGLSCILAGFVMGVVSLGSSHFFFAHAIVGIVAIALAILQPFNAILRPRRPRDEEFKSVMLCVWEVTHRWGGRVAVSLGLANVSVGTFLAVSTLPVLIAWHTWLAFLLLLLALEGLVGLVADMRRECRSPQQLTLHLAASGEPDSLINGWEKCGEVGIINTTTESVRL